MPTWRYIGCNIKQLPKEIRDEAILNTNEVKELMKTIPILEGRLEATNVEAVVSLLLHEDIMPIRLHKMTNQEVKIEKIRKKCDKS